LGMAISRSGVAVLPQLRTYVQTRPTGDVRSRGVVRLSHP
jgi:hypothetical protein